VLAGRVPNELVSWTKVTPSSVTLAPGTAETATAELAVPADASDGERYAVVLAEAPPSSGAGGLAVASRVGIRVYLSVGAGGEPASDFTISTITALRTPEGLPAVNAEVKNTGGRALDMSGTVELSEGPSGLRAGPFTVDSVRTLAIGATEQVLLKLDETLPAGPWKARLDMRSGFVERSATGTITFPDKGEAAPVDADLVEDDTPPYALIAAGVGGLLALLGVAYFLKRPRGRVDRKNSVVTVGPPAD
jgi:hypothetical protein